jgi:hypothetical protein
MAAAPERNAASAHGALRSPAGTGRQTLCRVTRQHRARREALRSPDTPSPTPAVSLISELHLNSNRSGVGPEAGADAHREVARPTDRELLFTLLAGPPET